MAHPRTHYGKHQPIPLSLIVKANEENQFSVLNTWIVLKQLHKRNTVIYNLHYETLSQRTGISHTTLRKHIRIMFEKRWVKWTKNGHLIITAVNKLKTHKHETTILVPVANNKADQILHLRKVILHRNIKNQEKQIMQKRELILKCRSTREKLSPTQTRTIRKAGGIDKIENSLLAVTTLSNKSIGKLFYKWNGLYLSKISGHRIQKKLREKKVIETHTRLQLHKRNSTEHEYKYMNREYKGYIYNPNTKDLFVRLSNEIVMLPKP